MAQSLSDSKLPNRKSFIDKVEIFGGPNLSFNYGNKFIENYKNENFTNKRLLKPDYVFGVGISHPLFNRLDLNVRFQYEKKGTRTELNTPSLPQGNRQIDYFNYSYKYLSILAIPQATVGKKKRTLVSLGVYYSKSEEMDGYGKTYDTYGTTKSEGSYKGRYFYDLRDDGTRQGFSWMPYLTSMEDYDLGIVCGIGYKIPFNKHSMLIQLQDNFGLKDINKDNPYDLNGKTHSASLLVSYTFHL